MKTKGETNLKALCKWVREEKGINKIDLEDLIEFLPEYKEWLLKDVNKQ